MPATTSKLKIPYPVAGDRITDYPATAKTAAETIEAGINNAVVGGPNGAIPPATAVLKPICYTFQGTTNAYGQMECTLPSGVSGMACAVVCNATKITENNDNGYKWFVTHINSGTNGAPIVCVGEGYGATRVANTKVRVAVFGIGW